MVDTSIDWRYPGIMSASPTDAPLWERVRMAWRDFDVSSVDLLRQALQSPEGQQLPSQVQNAIEAQLEMLGGDAKLARRRLIAASKKRPLDPHEKLILGFILIEDTDKATKLLHAVLKSGLRDPRIPEGLGQLAGRTGRFEDAIKHLAQAVRIDPQNWRARHGLGRAYMRLGRRGEAHDTFRTLVEQRPDFHDGWFEFATSATGPEQSLAAAKRLAPRLEDAPTDQLILAYADCMVKARNFSKAIEVTAPVVERSEDMDVILDHIELCLTVEDLERAARVIARAEQLDADQSRLWLFKGQLGELQPTKDVPGALAAYQRAVDLDKKSVRAKNALALLLMRPTEHADFARAQQLLTVASKEKSPAGWAALSNLALLHLLKERKAEAKQIAEQVAAVAPKGTPAREQADQIISQLA